MHILFETHGLNEFGESETFKAYEVISQAARYAQVSVVLPERWVKHVPSLPGLGVDVIPVRYDSRRFPLSPQVEYVYPLFADRALEAVRDLLPTVDVVHRLNPNAVRFSSAIALQGRPFVIGPLGWSRLPAAWALGVAGAARNALKAADRVRISSPRSRLHKMYSVAHRIALANDAALDVFTPELRKKCTTTYEWIDTNQHPALPRAENDEPVIVFVGRLIPYKGIEYLIQALARMTDLRWELRIVGDGPIEDRLKALVSRLGLSSRINFIGRVPRDEVTEHYRAADVCCFPGLNESSGNVNMEAMASGRALVVADWAGPREIVSRDCGIRVSVKSKKDFVLGLETALRDLIRDPDRCFEMGTAGRRRAEQVFDVRVAMAKFQRLHEEAASSAGNRDWVA